MTEGDLVWQERITKVVKSVAEDLLVNDEAEISEVLRRRLFENLGKEAERKTVALAYVGVTFSVEIGETEATYLLRELEQILADLNLADKIRDRVQVRAALFRSSAGPVLWVCAGDGILMPGVKEGRQAPRTLTRRCAPTSPLGARLSKRGARLSRLSARRRQLVRMKSYGVDH